MHTTARSVLAGFALMGVLAVGPTAGGQPTPAAAPTTLMAGWEQKFSLDWSVESERGGDRQILGYVTSQYGTPAESMTLLARALDASGTVVGQRYSYVPGGVPGLGRVPFVITGVPTADHYQVSVWDYSLLQSPSDNFR